LVKQVPQPISKSDVLKSPLYINNQLVDLAIPFIYHDCGFMNNIREMALEIQIYFHPK
jgi:hypothetical protein